MTHAAPNSLDRATAKGLRQFLDDEQQRAWLEGAANPVDGERPESHEQQSLEQRFHYTARFEKLLKRPQARQVLDILWLYGATCIPIPRTTERFYWSVSCLPSSDKALARVNASWMELFALLPDGKDVSARFILHLSDFTSDGSPEPDHLDHDLLESCVARPEEVSHNLWNRPDIFIVKVRGAASVRKFMTSPRGLRAIRNFTSLS